MISNKYMFGFSTCSYIRTSMWSQYSLNLCAWEGGGSKMKYMASFVLMFGLSDVGKTLFSKSLSINFVVLGSAVVTRARICSLNTAWKISWSIDGFFDQIWCWVCLICHFAADIGRVKYSITSFKIIPVTFQKISSLQIW